MDQDLQTRAAARFGVVAESRSTAVARVQAVFDARIAARDACEENGEPD